MTIPWSFSYNSFAKFYGKKIWEKHFDFVISKNLFYNEVYYKGTVLYYVPELKLRT